MPVLPELPPLPTNYDSVGDGGSYAGLLTGFALDALQDGPSAAIVVGHTMAAADLLLGVEVMASVDTHGGAAVEVDARIGATATDTIAVFGNAGVGYDVDDDSYVVLGVSAEAEVGNGWTVRADYRVNLDLSDQPVSHRILTGLVRRF